MMRPRAKTLGGTSLVLTACFAMGPAQRVEAGELGPRSSDSIVITVSVAPRLLIEPENVTLAGESRWARNMCMISGSASGLFSIAVDPATDPAMQLAWVADERSKPVILRKGASQQLSGKRSWSECRADAAKGSHLLIQPTPSGEEMKHNSPIAPVQVLLTIAPE